MRERMSIMISNTIKKLGRYWVMILGAIVLLSGIIWLVNYNNSASSALKEAENAYESGDFVKANSLYEYFFDKYAEQDAVGRVVNPWLFVSFDVEKTEARRYEVRDMTDAEKAFSEGEYYGAGWGYRDVIGSNGKYADIARNRLEEALLAWYEDIGESGAKLISAMYELTCIKELSTDSDDYRIALSDYDSEIWTALDYAENIGTAYPAKYWFPQASMGDNVARRPAEFRVAVCFDVVDTTNVEGCAYAANPQNPQGILGSVTRKWATYSVVLINPYTGKRFADSPPMPGTEPSGCPSSIVGGGMYEYIGPPDYAAALSWIEANFQSTP
jgi:hypothetical protein